MKVLSILLILIVITFAALYTPLIFAQENNQKIVTINQGEVINEDYYNVGETVRILGTVNGDVYIAGGDIIVEGNINGDLLVAGGNINLLGRVSQSVRAVGGQLNINGNIGKDLSAAGGNINVDSRARIGEDLLVAAGNLNLGGPVNREVTAAAGSMVISNTVGNDVTAALGSLSLTPQARINGDLTYYSNSQANIASGAAVTGQTVQRTPPQDFKDPQKEVSAFFTGLNILWTLSTMLASLVIGLLIIFLLPKFTSFTLDNIRNNPLSVLGAGFITVFLVPIIIFLLLITVLGIPLAFILFLIYLLALYVSRIFVMIFIGRLISNWLNRDLSLVWSFILGLIVYYLISWIPIIGWVFTLFAVLFGLGTIIFSAFRFSSAVESKKRKEIRTTT